MKGLSLTQPWATLVSSGAKVVETRSWPTSYRGPILIHAAKGFPEQARRLCSTEPFAHRLAQAGFDLERSAYRTNPQGWAKVLPLGVIVAVANLVAVHPITGHDSAGRATFGDGVRAGRVVGEELAFGDYAPGRYVWLLSGVRRLPEPIPYRGALGLWEVERELGERLERFRLGDRAALVQPVAAGVVGRR